MTVDGESRPLPDPFLVVATQNPIEYEGTYPLPEAQLDRFLFRIDVGYPGRGGRARRCCGSPTAACARRRWTGSWRSRARPTSRAAGDADRRDDRLGRGGRVRRRAGARTRELPAVELGASPRAAVHLLAASRAAARLAGRAFVTPDDVVAMATPVLPHRLVLRPEAELERVTPQAAVAAAIAAVAVPR